MHRFVRPLCLAGAALLLGGCDQVGGLLGIESPEKVAAAKDAEGRAIGGACRHAGRAIEDCYALYKKADKAAVFAGWRDMNDYMRENKIDAVTPTIATGLPAAKPVAADDSGDADAAGKTDVEAAVGSKATHNAAKNHAS